MNSGGADHDRHGLAKIQQENSPQGVSGHGNDDRLKHTHVGEHGSHNHQHGADLHAHHGASDTAKKIVIGEKVPDLLDASAGETMETVAKFAEKRGLTLPIALNANGTAADIFGVRATTTTVVIDRHGVLRYRGQFRDRQHALAEDALRAVLAGDDVPQSETPQKG